jgi:ankyrin repeat protein
MQRGETALMRAAFEGHADVVQFLLDNEADVGAQNEVPFLFLFLS